MFRPSLSHTLWGYYVAPHCDSNETALGLLQLRFEAAQDVKLKMLSLMLTGGLKWQYIVIIGTCLVLIFNEWQKVFFEKEKI